MEVPMAERIWELVGLHHTVPGSARAGHVLLTESKMRMGMV